MINIGRKIFFLLRVILALFMIGAGLMHFAKHEMYIPFVPKFLPLKVFIIYASGIVEILLGAMLLSNKYAISGGWGIFFLMLIFLPIHVADVFSNVPAIGSHWVAVIRLVLQFVILLWAWVVKDSVTRKASVQPV
jgi:uncharacterized membrane protein